MNNWRFVPMAALAFAVATSIPQASATTLIRASIDDLTTANSTIVLGEVVEFFSYWNADGTFILTDVRILAQETLKGNARTGSEFTFTIMGGTVGNLTTLILGGPELVTGAQYVLFLSEEDLPRAEAVLTVRDHSQGVFDVVRVGNLVRAVSQASRQPLVPDGRGESAAPGGTQGLLLDDLRLSVRQRVELLQIANPEEVQ
jgi:hypothetical protein